ncbi:MAG: ArnT family glycosyltransferase [Isosphaeraceae bacterium]
MRSLPKAVATANIRPAAAVAVATAALMLATEPSLAIAWDEGYTLGREARVRWWFRALADPPGFAAKWRPPAVELVQADRHQVPPPTPAQINSRSKLLFDRDVVAWFWPFAREEPHGHPPFYALLGLAGELVAPSSWRELPRARLGPILLFSLTAGAIHAFAAARWGRWPAALAAGSWVLQPNLFGNGHYAAYDGVLAALWVLAILVYARAVIPASVAASSGRAARWGGTVLFGVILGCAAATKLTGWFLPLPFLAWVIWVRNRAGLVVLLAGMAIAGIVLFALVPPWWGDPIGGVERFLRSNLTRARTQPIKVQFLGTIYDTPRQSLPWYNTLAWTVMVTPVGFLLLGVWGLVAAVGRRREEPVGPLIAGHWLLLVVLRALPHTPGHDGVRLFLPAFGMLALLGGVGAYRLIERSERWGRIAVAAAIAEGIVSLAVMMPVPLSYFSPVVGGLPGASAIGMEPTYYWDALDADARKWLAEHTPSGRTIQFATNPTSWLYLRGTGELPRRIFPFDPDLKDPDPPIWYVVQNRPGPLLEVDRALVARGHAAHVVTKLGVPLIWIFPADEARRLAREIREDR